MTYASLQSSARRSLNWFYHKSRSVVVRRSTGCTSTSKTLFCINVGVRGRLLSWNESTCMNISGRLIASLHIRNFCRCNWSWVQCWRLYVQYWRRYRIIWGTFRCRAADPIPRWRFCVGSAGRRWRQRWFGLRIHACELVSGCEQRRMVVDNIPGLVRREVLPVPDSSLEFLRLTECAWRDHLLII